jgi:hypothetical protein
MTTTFEMVGREVGALVAEKNAAYGDSFAQCGAFLRLLYPEGVRPEQYGDMLAIVRVWDKLKRIATDKDAFGESPWRDVCGYAILALARAGAAGEPGVVVEPAPAAPSPRASPSRVEADDVPPRRPMLLIDDTEVPLDALPEPTQGTGVLSRPGKWCRAGRAGPACWDGISGENAAAILSGALDVEGQPLTPAERARLEETCRMFGIEPPSTTALDAAGK